MTTLVARPNRVRDAGQRYQWLATAHLRLMVLMLVFLGVGSLIGLRLTWLAAFGDPPATTYTGTSYIPVRGDIVDRNGVTLASTMDAWSVGVHPGRLLGDPEDLAPKLAALMPERSEAEYLAILRSGRSFTYLRRRAMPELVAQVNALGEPAMAFAREPERLYPQTTLAAHVLGYTDFDGRGVTGVERALNARLTDPVKRADAVALSIDSRVQAAMESELFAAMTKHSAMGATGLVLDVDSGEVLALASLPVFNPNKFGKSPAEARRNNVTQSVYELGSTFKPLTIAQAMDTGIVTSMAKRYDATAPLAIGRFRIKDDHPLGRWITVPETLVHSSNIVTARIADEMGQARMEDLFRKLGFNEPPHIDLKEKGRTLWPHNWGRSTTLTTSYGHGIAVTPLHLASAYAALVNGGIWRPATVMKLEKGSAPAGRRVFTEATSIRMRQLLRLIVTEGTGRRGDAAGFRVGGKTGTAEKPGAGGYSRSVNVSTFAAAFPMDRPRYVVIAMLDAPKGTSDTFGFTSAAWTAAPVVSKVIARTGPMLGVIPDAHKDVDLADLAPLIKTDKEE
ncbi:peptidoglycan D,D-transpeptidase FtsI family protein [Sphingomonas cavernae]|uniref:Penicillin-binding protein 2 n=1 Tax=Sphingomonas cavernae TaxID=2320861 RepID=A0A418WKF7_9SPHN|nr:penicillin-binding protein 2 [Sphingomonas cavernae]RJF90524.1 penicillin-binding protein 2 [Sphingomonas cavernae]